jgi:hypothetical protein
MKSRLLIPFAILAALGAIFVAGCGGDDDTSSTTGTSGASGVSGAALSQEEFVSQANDICAAGNKETDAAANDTFSGGQPSQAEIEQFATDVLIPSVQGQIDAIRALVPPEEIADQVTTFLDDAESALDDVRDDPSSIAVSDNAGPFADVNKEADALGLTECGSD